MTPRILAVDDSDLNRDHLRQLLEKEGYEVETVGDGSEALDRLRVAHFHLVITDLRMPGVNGLSLLSRIREEKLPVGVIIVTAYGDTEDALQTMKAGADDFLTKPYDPEHLRVMVRRTLERRGLMDELVTLRNQLRGEYRSHAMVSKSPRMRKIFDLIEQIGPLGSTVLIHGETGTGKELVAQALHAADTRRKGAFVALNCAVLNDALLETELFGHERGSFTGAERRKVGRFEMANGGTLLLDEIGDVAPAMQAKLLRVLQSGQFERVGGDETITVDVRIVAASHKRLDDEVKAGRFRADLFYRLNVIRLELPPLRERTEDIPLLATHFVDKHGSEAPGTPRRLDTEAMQSILDHDWPGNVRELENAIKAALALAGGALIRREHLPESVAPPRPRKPQGYSLIDIDRQLPDLTEDLIGQVEREYFQRILSECQGNVARCARQSGLSRRSVTQKLLKYGLERTRFKRTSRSKGTGEVGA